MTIKLMKRGILEVQARKAKEHHVSSCQVLVKDPANEISTLLRLCAWRERRLCRRSRRRVVHIGGIDDMHVDIMISAERLTTVRSRGASRLESTELNVLACFHPIHHTPHRRLHLHRSPPALATRLSSMELSCTL
jgi:hypothetical protein